MGIAQGNATEAAKVAGYKSAEVEGCRLLKLDKVCYEIRKRNTRLENKGILTRQEKLERLAEIARAADEKLAMQAIDIDNKMGGEYLTRVEINLSQKPEEEIIAGVIRGLEERGYTVIPPGGQVLQLEPGEE